MGASRWAQGLRRREAFRALAGFVAGSPLLRAQQDPFRDHFRVPSMAELMTAFDFEAVAHAKLPRAAYDYTAYGSDSEFTLRRNREAFEWVKLVPRLPAAGPIDTRLQLLGTPLAFPILIAPTAAHVQLHPQGEMATHRGATAASATPMIVSNVSSFPIDKIAAAAKGPVWFQLYPRPEADANREVLETAQAAGCSAVVVTIDQQASYFERAMHGRHLGGVAAERPPRRPPPTNAYGLSDNRLWYSWKLFDQIRPFVKTPLLAKGVLTAEDARLCIEHGLDGVYVSNHGGRSLDYAPSTLEVLPEIVREVRGRVPVLLDSGVRRGTDILKALALGASAVCVGRPPRWGLGAFGVPGVQRVLEILQAELVDAMAQTGRSTLASIDSTLVRTDFP